ncbi:MAG: DNA-directed RNA polymerase subunit P [Candidatus Micrarchaeota archaeon]
MAWKCFSCGKKIDDISVVKCPQCSYKILVKEKPPIVRRVKTD